MSFLVSVGFLEPCHVCTYCIKGSVFINESFFCCCFYSCILLHALFIIKCLEVKEQVAVGKKETKQFCFVWSLTWTSHITSQLQRMGIILCDGYEIYVILFASKQGRHELIYLVQFTKKQQSNRVMLKDTLVRHKRHYIICQQMAADSDKTNCVIAHTYTRTLARTHRDAHAHTHNQTTMPKRTDQQSVS